MKHTVTNILLGVVAATGIYTGTAVIGTYQADWNHQKTIHNCYANNDTSQLDYTSKKYDEVSRKAVACIDAVYAGKEAD